MKKFITDDRRNKLAQILISKGSIKISELTEEFGVSAETLRKDILYLEEQGIAKKSHGGAVAVKEIVDPLLSSSQEAEVSIHMAEKALELLPKTCTVILDASPENLSLARLLTLEHGLTIFTNSIDILKILWDSKNDVYSFGGGIQESNKAILGYWAINELNTMNADFAFLGTDGLKSNNGPCTSSFPEAEFKKNAASRSNQVVILTESTKFEQNGLFKYCDWEDVDYLISDSMAPIHEIHKLEKLTNVVLAR